ncbi:MAG: hypothetical protein RLZZ480_305 [Candidatus Parcubacteria bacterium]
MSTYPIVRQDWLESERGWGIRPDGYSLHLTESNRQQFVREYWDRMPDEVPDEYSRPSGEPFLVDVDEATYLAVKASKNGTRHY